MDAPRRVRSSRARLGVRQRRRVDATRSCARCEWRGALAHHHRSKELAGCRYGRRRPSQLVRSLQLDQPRYGFGRVAPLCGSFPAFAFPPLAPTGGFEMALGDPDSLRGQVSRFGVGSAQRRVAMLLLLVAAAAVGCDPCIDRGNTSIKIVTHGTSFNGFWLQDRKRARASRAVGLWSAVVLEGRKH